MSYRPIHKEELVGTAVDMETIIRIRAELENTLIEQQREKGRVPLLELTPLLDTKYDPDTEVFSYKVVMHFVYVGPKKARQFYGELGGILIGG